MENTLITQDRLDSLVELCGKTRAINIAEVGVYKGGSIKYLSEHFPNAWIVGFDTFEGLPFEHWREFEVHKPHDFDDTSLQNVRNFLGDSNVELIPGIFPFSAEKFKYTTFDFVHVDTDFYESIKACIEFFYPRLSQEGIMVFDDYEWKNCPGVKKALNEFGAPIFQSAKHQAYIIK